jgi:DNA-binding transcriptional MerR regulator
LIIPFKKESNRNLFSQVDILRLKFIHKLLDVGGLNIAGIRSLLALIPCWEASEKGTLCKNTNCRECEVYRIVENYPDIKSFLKTLIP